MHRPVLWGLCVLVCVFLMAPLLVVVPLALSSSQFLQFPPPGYSSHWLSVFFNDPGWRAAIVLSLQVTGGAMVVATLTGTAAAYALVRIRRPYHSILEPMFVAPIIAPLIVYAVGAYLIAIKLGIVGSTWLLIVAYGTLALPYVVIIVGAALRSVNERLELAARSLGAGPVTAFRTVTLPLIAPAVITGALMTAAFSLDETVVALFLTADTAPTLPAKMYASIRQELSPVVPAAATVLVGATVIIGLALVTVRIAAKRRGLAVLQREDAVAQSG